MMLFLPWLISNFEGRQFTPTISFKKNLFQYLLKYLLSILTNYSFALVLSLQNNKKLNRFKIATPDV